MDHFSTRGIVLSPNIQFLPSPSLCHQNLSIDTDIHAANGRRVKALDIFAYALAFFKEQALKVTRLSVQHFELSTSLHCLTAQVVCRLKVLEQKPHCKKNVFQPKTVKPSYCRGAGALFCCIMTCETNIQLISNKYHKEQYDNV